MEVLFMSERGRPWRCLVNQEIQPHKTQPTFSFVYCTVQKAKPCDLYSSIVIKVINLADTISKTQGEIQS